MADATTIECPCKLLECRSSRSPRAPARLWTNFTASRCREVFETYQRARVGTRDATRQVVVMDNLAAHRSERARELIEARGCELLYLPPYSPDLKPSRRRSGRSRRCYGEREHALARGWWRP